MMNDYLQGLFFLIVFCGLNTSIAQTLEEDVPIDVNGFIVSYSIVNEKSVTVKKETFSRYEAVLSVKNETGTSYNIRLNKFPDLNALNIDGIVQFSCTNATGAKLTSKQETIKMRPHNLEVQYQTTDKNGKSVDRTMLAIAGYYFEEGDTRSEKVIFIVPEGERPEVKVRPLRN